MDKVDIIKGTSAKIAEIIVKTVETMAPAMQEALEQDPKWKAERDDKQRYDEAEQQVVLMLLANTLAVMRLKGCSDTHLNNVVKEALKLEAQNSKAMTS